MRRHGKSKDIEKESKHVPDADTTADIPEGAATEELPEVKLTEEEPVREADTAALAAELDMAKNQLLRTVADFDNYRKRVARDHERIRKTAAEALMKDLLPVLDNLERAVAHAGGGDGFWKGIDLILTQFREVLGRHGLRAIPSEGQPFDPHVHEAVTQVESAEVPAGHVLQEFEKGYWLGDIVLRPGKVSVSKGASGSAEVAETGPGPEPGS